MSAHVPSVQCLAEATTGWQVGVPLLEAVLHIVEQQVAGALLVVGHGCQGLLLKELQLAVRQQRHQEHFPQSINGLQQQQQGQVSKPELRVMPSCY